MDLKINWPEGATHYRPAFGRYPTRAYAVNHGEWSYWTGFDWHPMRFAPCESILRNLVPRHTPEQLAFEEKCERVAMVLLGKDRDPAPGVDWVCNRQWTVSQVRQLVRTALELEQWQ